MVDCAIVGVDWRDLTWWQYQAMMTVWNDRHSTGAPTPPPIDPDRVKAAMAAVSIH